MITDICVFVKRVYEKSWKKLLLASRIGIFAHKKAIDTLLQPIAVL